MDYLKDVRNQYENYPYPYRNPEDEKTRLLSTQDGFLEKINHYCFRGKQTFRNFRVLVAGGGTGSAAIFLAEQLREHKGAEIVYLDISQESMAIARKRAEIRGLENITWLHNSILDLPDLGLEPFDYINCVGVLHHLKDYHKGLRCLGSVLKQDGCMGIMVYGKHARSPIYQMQELMKLVNNSEPDMQEQVENTKTILSSLPPSNYFKRCENEWLSEVKEYGDIGVYDLFLHSQDHGFDVLELYHWVENCDFHLVEFIGPRFESKIGYEPQTFISSPKLLKKIAKLSRPKQQAIAELLSCLIQRHSFYLSRQTNSQATLDNLENIPFFFRYAPQGLAEQIENSKGGKIALKSPDQISLQFQPGRFTSAIFKNLNGQRTLKTIFNRVRKELQMPHLSNQDLFDDFEPIYEIFNNIGWILLRHSSTPQLTPVELLEERVCKKYQ